MRASDSATAPAAAPRKPKPSKNDLAAQIERSKKRVVTVEANVVSVELVEPFKPDVSPEPLLMFGLQDASGFTALVRAAQATAGVPKFWTH